MRTLVDTRGAEPIVIATTDPSRSGTVVGQILDLTGATRRRASTLASDAIAASAQTRGHIEQAVGVIAFVREITPDSAFAELRTASNDANISLHALAALLVDELPALHHDCGRVIAFLDSLTAPHHRAQIR